MRLLFLLLSIIALISAPDAAAENTAPAASPVFTTLEIRGATLYAEIAATPEMRRIGLSGRAELPPGAGMLLVFAEAGKFCLWMKNVYFPLDAAFIDSAGAVIGIVRMQAQTEDLHCAPAPATYALETNAGFLDETKLGDIVLGLPPP